MLNQITPVILTYNEAPNIGRTLDALSWATRIIVLDSFSNDDTQAICEQYSNVDFHQRKFDVHATQWIAAIALNINTTWVLALDADYVISDALVEEIKRLKPADNIGGYRTSFVYKIDGKALRGTLYPPVTTLYRLAGASYHQDGHTQRLLVQGDIETLSAEMFHDDRKPASRWHQSQRNYAAQEAKKFEQLSFSNMKLIDKIRFLGLGPIMVIPYTLFARGVLINGLPGLKYTYQRVLAEIYLLLARLTRK